MATNPFYQQYAQTSESLGQQIADVTEAQKNRIAMSGGVEAQALRDLGLTAQQKPQSSQTFQYGDPALAEQQAKYEDQVKFYKDMFGAPQQKDYHWGVRPGGSYRLW